MVKIHKVIAALCWLLTLPLRVRLYRFLFYRQVKVKVFLKGGNVVNIYCTAWEAKVNDRGFTHYKFTNMRESIVFDLNEIQAITGGR